MRDILDDLFGNEPIDPTESARRGLRVQLRKRFYQSAGIGEGAPHPVLLDGRAVKTPAGGTLAAPVKPLAEAIAAEWNAQGERIEPATMPLTRLANTIIDGVAPNPEPIADEIVKYLGSDLVCYRADAPEGLVAAQARHWDPVLAWTREAHGARFVLSEGVMFVAQPESAVAAARADSVRSVAARRRERHHHADRLGAARARGRARGGSASRRRGPPRMSTKTGTWSSGAATSSRCSAAPARFADMQAACMVLASA